MSIGPFPFGPHGICTPDSSYEIELTFADTAHAQTETLVHTG
jgi:hypothetical protein